MHVLMLLMLSAHKFPIRTWPGPLRHVNFSLPPSVVALMEPCPGTSLPDDTSRPPCLTTPPFVPDRDTPPCTDHLSRSTILPVFSRPKERKRRLPIRPIIIWEQSQLPHPFRPLSRFR